MMQFLMMIAFFAFLFVPIKESIHMYQQNRYQMKRYVHWLQKYIQFHVRHITRLACLFLPFYGLCFVPLQHRPQVLFMLLLLIYAYLLLKWDLHHEYIKTISFTHRTKRLIFMQYVLYMVFMMIMLQCFSIYTIILLIPILIFSPYFLLIIAGTIMYPIEQKIRYSYVLDAKRLLEKHEELIKVGITGSYGKTSVKNILHVLLSEKYYSFMSPHSYNNLMGLTISIRKLLKPIHEVFVAEIGADHVGEIRELANFIHPSMAIITAVGPQHLETFGSQENILQEKMQLVEHLDTDAIAIINYDNECIRSYEIRNTCNVLRYGIHHEDVDVRAKDIVYSIQGSQFTIVYQKEQFQVQTCLLGEHNVLNILAAICGALALHVPIESIKEGIKRLRYVPHRLEVCKRNDYILLDDAYNSNPQGAKYALEVLSQMKGTRILMTPGFLDLGSESMHAHIAYGKQIKQHCDIVILIGPLQCKDIYQSLLHEEFPSDHLYVVNSTKEAFLLLSTLVKKDDTVLIENDLPDAFNY